MKLWDEEGNQYDLDEVRGIQANCFMCTRQIKEKGGILLSPPNETYSDNVDTTDKFHLCKKCFDVVLDFTMGKVKQVELPPKLGILLHVLNNGNVQSAMELVKELQNSLLQGEKQVN